RDHMEELFLILGVLGLFIALIAIVPMLTTKRRIFAAVASVLGVLSLAHAYYLHSKKEEVSIENVDTKVRGWLDAINITSGKVPDAAAYFNYSASAPKT